MTRRRILIVALASTVATLLDHQQFLTSNVNDSSWQKYIRAPSFRTITPISILSHYTAGNVLNGDVLVGQNSADSNAILSRLTVDDSIPTIVLDFGQNVAGILSVSFAGSMNVSEGYPGLMLAFSETLEHLSNRSDFTRSDNAAGTAKLTPGTDQIAVKPDTYTWADQLGCEYHNKVCADGFHGFRYVKLRLAALPSDAPYTSNFGSISISSISLTYTGYLGRPGTFTGHFECSDGDITQWWYDAVYTNDLCIDIFRENDTEPRGAAAPSLLGKLVLHDGAKRDRDPYVGDLAVSALTTYLSHDIPAAVRNVLEDLANHQHEDGWIPPASINNYTLPLFDYPLWWVLCSIDYVMYTGNTSYLDAYYTNVVGVLDTFYVTHTNPVTNLIERPDGTGDFAFIPRTGPVTYYNALYVYALKQAAMLADMQGRNSDASRWRMRAINGGSALINRNFDNATGAFFDGGPCLGTTICPTHAQDGNSFAILSGVANSSMAKTALNYLHRTTARSYGNAFYDNSLLDPRNDYSNRVYAFISYFEIAARFTVSPDTSQSAIEETRRLYGWMATHDPFGTFWEGIGANGSAYEGAFTSMAHGWSTGIVPLAINYILGVTPAAPGFRRWLLKPILNTDITWASGVVPTPYGGISVQWQKQANRILLLIDTPTVTNGTMEVPFTTDDFAYVSVDGVTVYNRNDASDNVSSLNEYTALSLNGGKHSIVLARWT